jgi:hypothetical protein
MKVTTAQLKIPIVQTLSLLVAAIFIYSYLKGDPLNPTLYQNIFHTLNLVFHEAGHTLFMWGGNFIYVIGGSLFQILMPLVIALYFWGRNEIFETSIILMWVAANIYEVGVYMSDAKDRALPLLGDDPESHDWYAIFSQLNILHQAPATGEAFIILSFVVLTYALLVALYTIWAPFVEYKEKKSIW